MNRKIYNKPQLYTNKDELLQFINEQEQALAKDYSTVRTVIRNLSIPELHNNCTYRIMRDLGGYILCIYQIEDNFNEFNEPNSEANFICILYYCY